MDIGYAEFSAAAFYVSHRYSEVAINDGLTWGVDAFATIEGALDAAAAALGDLQGALPEGGYSVAVDTVSSPRRSACPATCGWWAPAQM